MSVQSRVNMAKITKHVTNNQFWDTQKVSYMGSQISRWTQKTQLETVLSQFIIHTSDKNLQQFKSESLLSDCHVLCHNRELGKTMIRGFENKHGQLAINGLQS